MKQVNKELFIKNIDKMINNSDKGASGFWTDTEDCCGNPEIFSEIKNALKEHKSVYLEYDICPWNRDVMYGSKDGHIQSGCFHCCGLYDARYLSSKMLRDILLRFKKRYLSGEYDNHKDYKSSTPVKPLLTKTEEAHIEKEKHLEPIRERNKRLKRAENAVKMHPNNKHWKNMLGAFYETNTVTADGIVFSKNFAKGIVGGEKLTYDECLELQWKSVGKKEHTKFKELYINQDMPIFKGQIDKINNEYVCFNRIFIDYMRMDGIFNVGKEDHVWMDKRSFKKYNIGDCVEFYAEVYRYIKTSNGKILDYGLRNPKDIKKIDKYQLPSDKQLQEQIINDILCESCFLYDQCDRSYCIRNGKEKRDLKKSMMAIVSNKNSVKEGQ